MRRMFRGMVFVALTLTTMAVLGAQQSKPAYPWAGQDAAVEMPTVVTPPSVQFTPRELSGVWMLNNLGRSADPAALARARTGQIPGQSLSDDPPPKTPAGDAIFRKSIVARVNEIQAEKDVPPPAVANDPILRCDPWGFPRVLYDFMAPMEF